MACIRPCNRCGTTICDSSVCNDCLKEVYAAVVKRNKGLPKYAKYDDKVRLKKLIESNRHSRKMFANISLGLIKSGKVLNHV